MTESRVSQLRAEALILLRDGSTRISDPDLVSRRERPGGCVARRREAYYAQIAASGRSAQPAGCHGSPWPARHSAGAGGGTNNGTPTMSGAAHRIAEEPR